jgi:hypothetical protein
LLNSPCGALLKTLFEEILNDYYICTAAINLKGESFPTEPLFIALLLSQHKIIDWLTKVISKHESPVNNGSNKEI